MDPKIIQLLRLFLGVDDKLLPDSMTPDDFGKFIDDQKGKLFGNPEDFKNLQQIISKKDVNFRKTKEALEKLKAKKQPNKDADKETEFEKLSKNLQKKLEDVENQLVKINKAGEVASLKKQYPDILPELLVGKTEDEVKAVVEKQRIMTKKLYGDSRQFTQPTYEDVADIDKAIDEVKADKTMTGEKRAVKVMQLNRAKENFQAPEPDA